MISVAVAAAVAVGLIFVGGPLRSPEVNEGASNTVELPQEETPVEPETNSPAVTSSPTEEPQHGTMAMEQIAERTGNLGQVLHDDRMMIALNSYNIADTLRATGLGGAGAAASESGNRFLTVDLSVRSIGHTLPLSPNVFRLTTGGAQELAPSPFTPLVDGGMKTFYLPEGQAARVFLVFESPFFGDNLALKYSDRMSTFDVTLSAGAARPNVLISETEPQYTTDDLLQAGSLQLKIINITSIETDSGASIQESGTTGDKAFKISLAFQNTGNSVIRIDPSYIFVQDNKLLYLYGMHTSLSASNLASPLKTLDLEPGKGVTGDVIIALPADSSDLILAYFGPNNTFLARIP